MKHLLITIAAVVLLATAAFADPIHDAVEKGNLIGVQAELDKVVDVNAKREDGSTPLHSAATKEIAELLIAKGADVNAKDKIGGTSLHLAAHSGQKEIVELLIANGVNINAKIEAGKWKDQTSLSLAIQNNQTATADLIRKHGGKTGEELKAEAK